MEAWLLLLLGPFALRIAVFGGRFFPEMCEDLSDEELDRSGHTAKYRALLGLAVAVTGAAFAYNPGNGANLELVRAYAVASAFFFLAATLVQSWKIARWQDMIGDASGESGLLGLVACLVAATIAMQLSSAYFRLAVFAFGGLWLLDFGRRVLVQVRYFSRLRKLYESRQNRA